MHKPVAGINRSKVCKSVSFVNKPVSFVNKPDSIVNKPDSIVNKPVSFVNKPVPGVINWFLCLSLFLVTYVFSDY